MRLINIESMTLEDFMGSGSHVPRYAILSHTWEDGEVTFQDFTNPDKSIRSQKKGFAKIEKTRALTKEAGLTHVWVDTCCIDKSSSAELTEAINSMFQWYRDSVICYAWLADLPTSEASGDRPDNPQLGRCRWFTRGWTLQELIAPKVVYFYDQGWTFCGTKGDLSSVITEITNISEGILRDPGLLSTLSVAQRMSWAAPRQTTRVEDMAYCLLGIFDANMPMLYGEGTRAFLRLQEEIAKESNDLSIFAWKTDSLGLLYSGVFATSPADFRASGSVQLVSDTAFNPEFLMTNKGLRMNTSLYSGKDGCYLLKLNCSHETATGKQHIGIWIKPHGGGVYSRAKLAEFGVEAPEEVAKTHDVFLFKRISTARSRELERSHSNAFMLRRGFNARGAVYAPEFPFEATLVVPKEEWDSQRRMFLTHGAADFSAYLYFHRRRDGSHGKDLTAGTSFLLAFGKIADEKDPWITVLTPHDDMTVFTTLLDVKKVIAGVRSRVPQQVALMRNASNKAVSVSMAKADVDGQEVYCIDLVYGHVETLSLRQDTPKSRGRSNT